MGKSIMPREWNRVLNGLCRGSDAGTVVAADDVMDGWLLRLEKIAMKGERVGASDDR